MGNTRRFMSGAAVGAGLAYFLDRDRGRRRRAMMRDCITRSRHRLGDASQTTWRDLRHRATGVLADARSRARPEPVTDDVLTQQVRAQLGRVVTHPRSIDVTAHDGQVTLRGPILSSEAPRLLNAVRKLQGVAGTADELERHEVAGRVPGLQGVPAPPAARFEFFQEHWSPAARAAGMAGGGLMAAAGARRGGIGGAIAGAAGLMIAARGLTNMPVRRLLGVERGPEGIELRKTINVDAPLGTVFELWADLVCYPLFMDHVREVRKNPDGSYHWVVAGPAGIPVEWDAVVTKLIPNQELSWASVPGTLVEQSGTARFTRNPDGGTRIDVRMTYNPPAGVAGHVIATAFGSDPKHQMDEDLVRFKSLVESGKTTAHGEEVTLSDVGGEPPEQSWPWPD